MEGAEQCFFDAQWGIKECPYEKLYATKGLPEILSFVVKAMDSWEVDADPVKNTPRPGHAPMTEKKKKRQYGLSVEKFNWACQLHMVKQEDQLTALTWCGIAVKAANEAPDLQLIKQRKERAEQIKRMQELNR
jgi:hypothetical protein